MGFAKYHEDNIEMWEERNRYRKFPKANINPFQCDIISQTQTKRTNASSRVLSRKQKKGRVYDV